MGSSNSRLGSRPPRPPRAKRNLLSLMLCGASTSRSQIQMEDSPAELLVNSAQYRNPALNKLQRPKKESGLAADIESRFSSLKIEHAASSASDIEVNSSPGDSSVIAETSNHGRDVSQSKETIPPHRLSVDSRSRDIASTSYHDRSASGSISTNGRENLDGVSGDDSKMDKDLSQICSTVSHIPSLHDLGGSFSDGLSIDNHASEVTSVHDSASGSASIVSDSPVNFDLLRHDNIQEETPSDLEFVSDREQGERDENILHLDVVSASANILSSSNAEAGSREARRNSRRLFWDAFSRRNSRRHSDSRTSAFGNDESDDLGSHNRWLVDFNGDVFDDGFRGDTGFLGSSTHSINERRRHSRSEIWERLRGGREGSGRRTSICPSGLHTNGTCTCESILMAEESSARASISRIVMLAEALFEVLDEIHRQPVSLSLSMVSLPAPESVVDSLPVKYHTKTPKTGDEDDQCYICLAEYEEGDKIRVLPCHHEYHLSCVDKWLKEMHGVCPLCRGDVRESSSTQNPELHSLS